MGEFFEVVYQAEQLPLVINFGVASEGETIQLFVNSDVTKHGFYHGHAVAVDVFSCVTVYPLFHPFGIGAFAGFVEDEGDWSTIALAMIGSWWVLHATCFLVTMPTLQQTSFKEDFVITVFIFAFTPKTELFTCRTGAGFGDRVKLESGCWVGVDGASRAFIATGLFIFVLCLLFSKTGITTAEGIIGDIGINLVIMQVLVIVF